MTVRTTFDQDLARLRELFPSHVKPLATVVANDRLATVEPLRIRGWLTLATSTWISGGMIATPTAKGKAVLSAAEAVR